MGRYFLNFRPQMSPNKRYVLLPGIGGYVGPGSELGTGLWLADLQDDHLRQILPRAKIATWSPESDQITYVDDDTLYALTIDDDSTPIQLFTHSELVWLYARWSPDGRWIVTTSETKEQEDSSELEGLDTFWLIPTSGDPVQQLTTKQSIAIEHIADEILWSANSQFLLIRNEVFNLSGEQISLPFSGQVHWLPNRPQLLLNGRDGLRLMTIEGKEIASISDSFSSAWTFSHDGQQLAYSQSTNDDNQVDIFIYDIDKQKNQFINSIPISYLSLLRWSSNDDYLFMDDGQESSPIWVMSAQPNSTINSIVDKGILIETITIPSR